MAWPVSQDYNEAIQYPESSFGDPELRTGHVVTNAMGLPMPRSGNFADVYEFVGTSGVKWALKCFTREVPDLQERYGEISRHLQQARLPFMVEFQFLPKGIRIRGQCYPVLKMQWVEGFLLNEFVRNNLDKPAVLEGLCQIWLRMARRLHESGMAHADLQHGNVILVPGSKAASLAVKLIDYDGMFVPSLAGRKSGEVGHANYQHPQRLRDGTYNADVDRFPHLVVYTALRGLVRGGPDLWKRYDNGDNLLFKQSDLEAPAKSALFAELLQKGDAEVRKLVQTLAQSAATPLAQAPLLDRLAGPVLVPSIDRQKVPPRVTPVPVVHARVTPVPVASKVARKSSNANQVERANRNSRSRPLLFAAVAATVVAALGVFSIFAFKWQADTTNAITDTAQVDSRKSSGDVGDVKDKEKEKGLVTVLSKEPLPKANAKGSLDLGAFLTLKVPPQRDPITDLKPYQAAATVKPAIDPSNIPLLKKLLTDKAFDVQRDAIMELERIASSKRKLPSELKALLVGLGDDTSNDVRGKALETVARHIEPDDKDLLPALTALSQHTSYEVRSNAALAVCKLDSTQAEKVLTVLSELLKDPKQENRLFAVSAIRKLGAKAADVLPALVETLGNAQELAAIRKDAGVALENIGSSPEAEKSVPKLLGILTNKDDDPSVRHGVLSALRVHNAKLRSIMGFPDALTQVIQEDAPGPASRVLRYDCAYLLGFYFEADVPDKAMDVLAEFLKDGSIRLTSGQSAPGTKEARKGDGRLMAVQALARIGAKTRGHASVMSALVSISNNDKADPQLRQGVQDLLKAIGGANLLVPPETAQANALRLVREWFKQDYLSDDPRSRNELAIKLEKRAAETADDAALRYVLLLQASEMAAEAGVFEHSFRILRRLTELYDGDIALMRKSVVARSASNVTHPASAKAVAEGILALLHAAVAADNYRAHGDVKELLALVKGPVQKSQDKTLISAVQKQEAELADVLRDWESLSQGFDVLKSDPSDSKANQRIGRIYAFRRGDWDKALPFLARGEEGALKTASQTELAKSDKATEQMLLAGEWLLAAAKETGKEKLALQKLAHSWYQKALPRLTDIEQAKAEKKLEDLENLVPTLRPPAVTHTLTGHKTAVLALAISADGKYLASGSRDGVTCIWDTSTGKQLHMVEQNAGPVSSLGFIGETTRLLICCGGKEVRNKLAVLEVDARTNERGSSMSRDANGNENVTAFGLVAARGKVVLEVMVTEIPGGPPITLLRPKDWGNPVPESKVPNEFNVTAASAVMSHDGKWALTSPNENRKESLRLWELGTAKSFAFAAVISGVQCLAISHDKRRSYSGGSDKLVRIWDNSTGVEMKKLTGHTGTVQALAVSQDDKRVLSGGVDKTVRVWDVSTGKELRKFAEHKGVVTCVEFSPDGKVGFAGAADGTVLVLRLPLTPKVGGPAPKSKAGEEIKNSIGTRLVFIPMGKFMMGSAESDMSGAVSDRPQHEVEITKGFYLGVYEVTQEEFEAVMGTNPSQFKGARLPVENVSWFDVKEFCRKLTEKEVGKKYRLPTEAEWEYACRAGTTTVYYCGNQLGAKDANFASKRTKEVGNYAANKWGLYDMHGNVWEWCEDWYGAYKSGPIRNPTGTTSGSHRVMRGGSWNGNAGYCRSANRHLDRPADRFNNLGFRLALEVGP